jgi:hypothetical protein
MARSHQNWFILDGHLKPTARALGRSLHHLSIFAELPIKCRLANGRY